MSTKQRQVLQHLKSSQLNKDGNGPLYPNTAALHDGELAINYADGVETLFIKNTNNECVSFKTEEYYQENYSTKAYADGKIFMGTQEEYMEAWKNGLITVGALVIIVDDSTDVGGGEDSDSSDTTALLGKAVLGKMILGKNK